MKALLRYESVLLLRSRRWLPPLLLYTAFIAIGVQTGQPLLDGLGYAAAALLPIAAWLVRVCTTNEPPSARTVLAAATSPAAVHLACVLTAMLAAIALGLAGTITVLVVSDPRSANGQVEVSVLHAGFAGFVTALVCVMLGTAVGVMCNWPVLRSPGRAIPATALAALLVLVMGGSPAQAAVSGLVTGSLNGTVRTPLLPLIVAALLTTAATALACRLSSNRI